MWVPWVVTTQFGEVKKEANREKNVKNIGRNPENRWVLKGRNPCFWPFLGQWSRYTRFLRKGSDLGFQRVPTDPWVPTLPGFQLKGRNP